MIEQLQEFSQGYGLNVDIVLLKSIQIWLLYIQTTRKISTQQLFLDLLLQALKILVALDTNCSVLCCDSLCGIDFYDKGKIDLA